MRQDHNDRFSDAGAKERRILHAALELFRDRGFDGVTVDQIGDQAGLNGPAIYRSFENKNDILATLFDEAMDRLQQLAGPVRDDPQEELEALIGAQVAFALGDVRLLSVYAREDRSLAGDARRRLNRRQRAHVNRWASALAQLHRDLDGPELLAMAHGAIGLLLSVAHWPDEALEHPGLEARLVLMARQAVAPGGAID